MDSPSPATTTDKLTSLVAALHERAATGEPPIRLVTTPDHLEGLRKVLTELGAPEGSYVLEVGTPPPRPTPQEIIARALANFPVDDPYRRARAAHVATNVMLGQYRHNDPAVAAKYRAERLAKRAARRS